VGLFVVDVQEKLFPLVQNSQKVAQAMVKAIRGCQILGVPIVVSEQYPQGLGQTISVLKEILGDQQLYQSKTTFSALRDPQIHASLQPLARKEWIVMGIEAHICVFQTARDLLAHGYSVTLLKDGVSSRCSEDVVVGIEALRHAGAHIGSVELVLFELLGDAHHPRFKEISQLIKNG
jgi:nicotinamidase-related amidase